MAVSPVRTDGSDPGLIALRPDPSFRVGPVNRRIFGSFVEHMGRCVYTGIHQPDHPSADSDGFRSDVAALVEELGVTLVRYPGGNFVSNYHWEDGVGPKQDRPTRLDLAWRSIETNQVGTDDFLGWCEARGVEPMLAVNLGTRGLSEALDLLQYVNADADLELVRARTANGRTEPWGVRIWCLGNEMDGPWQMGHKTPAEYARLAEETARAMKRFDPSLELVACGSSNRSMPTFGEWERVVLDRCFDQVDHISAHAYYEPFNEDLDSFLAAAEDMERFINSVVATADHVAAMKRSEKRIMVSFDEWNVWYAQRFGGEDSLAIREAPRLIEDVYSVLDAVVVGSLLITLLRHTDRVSMACQAQLVNVIGPIMTNPEGGAWRQTIFHPFALTARYAHGTVLQLPQTEQTMPTERYGEVEQLWSTATWDADSGALTVFAVNRGRIGDLTLDLDLGGFGDAELLEHLVLTDDDPDAVNTEDAPDRVRPTHGTAELRDGRLRADLPAISWHCIRLRCSHPSTSHPSTSHPSTSHPSTPAHSTRPEGDPS